MIITNYGSYLGKPRLTLTRSGNTLTVKTYGPIPNNLGLFMCYSTLSCQRRCGYSRTNRHHRKKSYRGRKRFSSRGDYISSISSNSTYTFQLLTPKKWDRVSNPRYYDVRAELRSVAFFGARTRYVSNILHITI